MDTPTGEAPREEADAGGEGFCDIRGLERGERKSREERPDRKAYAGGDRGSASFHAKREADICGYYDADEAGL